MPPPEAISEALLGTGVGRLERLPGGGNNRLYHLRAQDGRDFALKTYARDRLGAEFGGLDFLWSRGERRVPRPIAADATAGPALYDWIDGEAVTTPGPTDLATAVDFVAALRRAGEAPEARALPLASEACLSGREVLRQIAGRRTRLGAVGDPALRRFLLDRFDPLHARLVGRLPLDPEPEILPETRLLSPSDFGFHNALRRPDDALVFLDFEYFGWDDPAKLIADFELHPAMGLSPEMAHPFRAGALALFPDQPALGARVAALRPLFALRWSLIVLNPFLPQGRRRQDFLADGVALDALCQRHLATAEALLSPL